MPGRSPRRQRATLHAPSPAAARSAGRAHVTQEEGPLPHRACSTFVLGCASCQDRRLTMRRSGSITRPNDTRAALRRSLRHPNSRFGGHHRLRGRPRSAHRAEGHDPAPPDRLVLGHVDADHRGQLLIHPQDPAVGSVEPDPPAVYPGAGNIAAGGDARPPARRRAAPHGDADVVHGRVGDRRRISFLPGRIMHAVVFSSPQAATP